MEDHDADRLKVLQKQLVSEDALEEVVSLFKVLRDPSRLRIINALMERELCVHELVELMGMTQPAVSQQLKHLKLRGMVSSRREGTHIYYTLESEALRSLFKLSLRIVGGEPVGFIEGTARLEIGQPSEG